MRYFLFIIVIFIIPALLGLGITQGILTGYYVDGNFVPLGVYIFVGLYWVSAWFIYQHNEAKKTLNRILDILLDDKEVDDLFELAKKRRQLLRENKCLSLSGGKRANWFLKKV